MKFEQIIGQQKAKNQVYTAIKNNRLPHAIVLNGKPGLGGLPFANALAQLINCIDPTETDSCGVCHNCTKISKGIHPDIRFILPIISKTEGGKQLTTDAFFKDFREAFLTNPYISIKDWTSFLNADNKQLGIHIAEIRNLKKTLSLKAFEAKEKVIIIWKADKLHPSASNALLKILEEPPEHTKIILTVNDTGRLLNTIKSRCQIIQLHRIKEEKISDYLHQNHTVESSHAFQLAQLSEGSLGRAIELSHNSDQPMSELFTGWLRACWSGNFNAIAEQVDELSRKSREFQKLFLSFVIKKIRDAILFSMNVPKLALIEEEEKKIIESIAKQLKPQYFEPLVNTLEKSLFYINRNANPKMVFTVLSLKIHSLLKEKK